MDSSPSINVSPCDTNFCQEGTCCEEGGECCIPYYRLWWFWVVWFVVALLLLCFCVSRRLGLEQLISSWQAQGNHSQHAFPGGRVGSRGRRFRRVLSFSSPVVVAGDGDNPTYSSLPVGPTPEMAIFVLPSYEECQHSPPPYSPTNAPYYQATSADTHLIAAQHLDSTQLIISQPSHAVTIEEPVASHSGTNQLDTSGLERPQPITSVLESAHPIADATQSSFLTSSHNGDPLSAASVAPMPTMTDRSIPPSVLALNTRCNLSSNDDQVLAPSNTGGNQVTSDLPPSFNGYMPVISIYDSLDNVVTATHAEMLDENDVQAQASRIGSFSINMNSVQSVNSGAGRNVSNARVGTESSSMAVNEPPPAYSIHLGDSVDWLVD